MQRSQLPLLFALTLLTSTACSGGSSGGDSNDRDVIDETDVADTGTGSDTDDTTPDTSVDPGDTDTDDADTDDADTDDADAAPADVDDDTAPDATPCDDADGDGVCDDEDVCEGFDDHEDTDGDGIPNGCDACSSVDDTDEDGVPDDCDVCPDGDDLVDDDGDGVPDACDVCAEGDDGVDADGDTVPDACDVCADADDLADDDGDGIPDACDVCAGGDDEADDDGDGIPDACDVCPAGDDALLDPDGDLACGDDNCPTTPNADQTDSDGDGVGDACDPNGPPSVAAVRISPDPASTNDALFCTADGISDPDGDAVTLSYRWTVNDAPAGSDASLSSAHFERGDTVRCEVTPNDGEEDGAPVSSAPLTVQNTPPTAPSVVVTPGSPSPSDDLVCAASGAADADGDALTYVYRWYRDDELQTGLTTATVSASETAPGESWTCTAVATDGTEEGPEQSDTVVIAALPALLGGRDAELSCSVGSFGADYILGSETFTLDGPGTLSGFHLLGCGTNIGVKMALYTMVGDDVRDLVATSEVGRTSDGWIALSVAGGSVDLSAGRYLIAAIYETDGNHAAGELTGVTTYYQLASFSGALPSPMNESSYAGQAFSYWVEGVLR